MGSRYFPSVEPEAGRKFLLFVFGSVVIFACVCFVAVLPLCLENVLRGTINACVCEG